jgi:hypothetical protein
MDAAATAGHVYTGPQDMDAAATAEYVYTGPLERAFSHYGPCNIGGLEPCTSDNNCGRRTCFQITGDGGVCDEEFKRY